jgi:glycerophosphoryl diester phosphodiesterase
MMTTLTAGESPLDPDALERRAVALVDAMDESALKDRLASCRPEPRRRTNFSIAHRGAPLAYPEHTRESYLAAARQGAGVIECDVTFTRDRALVCRHSQCDLHTTTNILQSALAERCSAPFTPADPDAGTPAGARCCTSDLTQAEFRSLCGRRDRSNPEATSVADYLGTADPAAGEACGTLMTHAESITLFDGLGIGMMPELKAPEVPMPYQGDYRQQDFVDQLIAEYARVGIDPDRVRVQSFDLNDLEYLVARHPAFARRAVYLDGRANLGGFDASRPESLIPTMEQLAARGVAVIAPPLWVLLTLEDERIVPSAYARAARAAGLDIVAWTVERSGSLHTGGGYYYQSVAAAIDGEGDVYTVIDVLARDVGVIGIFSDWPATVTHYANCTRR